MDKKALGLLSIARKGGNLEAGEEPVGAACRAGRARLVVLAQDAAPHTVRRARSFVAGTKQPCLTVACSKEELGAAVGRAECAMAALTDVRLARAFVQALGEGQAPPELLAELEARSQRADRRQQEERAHQANLRRGGKKKN